MNKNKFQTLEEIDYTDKIFDSLEVFFESELNQIKYDSDCNKYYDSPFPGFQLLIAKDAKIIYNKAHGNRLVYDGIQKLEKTSPANKNTLYDLASNTKMYSVNFILQHLIYTNKINLDDKVAKYIDSFYDRKFDSIKGKDKITIRNLLQHTAGFPTDFHYFKPNYSELYSMDKKTMLKNIGNTPLKHAPQTIAMYSDIDYILLGFIIEAIVEKPLDVYLKNLFSKLNLKNIVYNPLKNGFVKDDIAATELMGNTREDTIDYPFIRRETVCGEVHDEKAFYCMNGVSGHAGLFSNAGDLAVLLQLMLNGGGYNDTILFTEKEISMFTEPSKADPTFGLGWRTNAGDGYFAFESASKRAYGHTGWTGTLTLIDPEYNLLIVFLSNRKHSRIVDKNKDQNIFEGDKYLLGGYRELVSRIYNLLKATL